MASRHLKGNSDPDMDTHLIIAVHGIGEQEPGETVDSIVGAATATFYDRNKGANSVLVEKDVIKLSETRFDNNERQARLYPVHLRRVRRALDASSNQQAVFAEVFWAEKSPAPKGAFWTMFDLLRVVLGLGYLAMENAESNRGPKTVALVHLFTWCFYGLVAPLNAMLLFGAMLMLVDLSPYKIEDSISVLHVLFAHSIITFVVGLYVLKAVAKTYLVRIFGWGLTGLGLVVFAIAFLGWIGVDFDQNMCGFTDTDEPSSKQRLECFVRLSIDALGLVWLITVFLALATLLPSWIGKQTTHYAAHRYVPDQRSLILKLHQLIYGILNSPRKKRTKSSQSWLLTLLLMIGSKRMAYRIEDNVPGQRAIFAPICAGMVVFWMVLSSAFWLTFVNIIDRISTSSTHIDGRSLNPHGPDLFLLEILERNLPDALSTLSITTALFLLLLVCAGCLIGYRKLNASELYRKPDWASRVILNPIFQVLLMLALCVICATLFYVLWHEFGPGASGNEGPLLRHEALLTLTALVNGLLLVAGLAIYNFNHIVAGGLGIVRDIVTYATQSHCEWLATRPKRKRNFEIRNDINNRFKRAVHYGLETFAPKMVTIISHSQGTVIATQMLQDPDVHRYFAKQGNPKVKLVTMGSPVTHVYRRYFREFFQVRTSDMPPETEWYNIHREDDFVGTRIGEHLTNDDPDLAKNRSVLPGGHSGYFTDFQVWQHFWDEKFVCFELFPGGVAEEETPPESA